METILAWARNRGLDGALKSKCSTRLQGKIYTTYHRDMLKRFGVCFGKEGGFSFINVKRFPPLVMPSDLGALRIEIDYIGGVDCALLPYGGLVRDIRIGFVHLPLPQANEVLAHLIFFRHFVDGIWGAVVYRVLHICVQPNFCEVLQSTDCRAQMSFHFANSLSVMAVHIIILVLYCLPDVLHAIDRVMEQHPIRRQILKSAEPGPCSHSSVLYASSVNLSTWT